MKDKSSKTRTREARKVTGNRHDLLVVRTGSDGRWRNSRRKQPQINPVTVTFVDPETDPRCRRSAD